MQTYCQLEKNTGNKDARVMKTKNDRLMSISVCNVCGHKKSKFVSKNEGSGLLSSLGIRIPLSKKPILNTLF